LIKQTQSYCFELVYFEVNLRYNWMDHWRISWEN